MSADIKATLPPNIRFINSTSQPDRISEDTITWTIDRLNTGKRRTISFMGEAENDGFYVSMADIHVRSLDGREMESIKFKCLCSADNVVYVITPTSSQDWCPCDENLLGSLSWNGTIVRGSDLGRVC